MTHPTDEELDALVNRAGDAPLDDKDNCFICYEAASTIISLRTQLAEARAERDAMIHPDHVEGLVKLAEPMIYEALAAETARADRAEAEVRNLKAAIFGSENYAHDLKCGNFVEMAQTLHAAQKGGLDRAERAEAALAEIKQTLGAPVDWHPVYAVKALKQSNDLA